MTEASPGVYMGTHDGTHGPPDVGRGAALLHRRRAAARRPARARLGPRRPSCWSAARTCSPGTGTVRRRPRRAFVDGTWFRTGDVLRVDDDGWAHVVDRVKDMYISGGENVYPAEVEAVAVRLDAVADCAVVGVADARWGEVGAAYVQVREGAALTEAELRAHLRGHTSPATRCPSTCEFVAELPRNATGKIRRVELRHRAADEHPIEQAAASRLERNVMTTRRPDSCCRRRCRSNGTARSPCCGWPAPAKRNALDDPTVLGIEAFFATPPEGVKAVVLDAEGDHFCAGLDLSELTERDAFEGLEHSRMWHRAFERHGARADAGRRRAQGRGDRRRAGAGVGRAPAGGRAERVLRPARRASTGCSSAAAARCGCRG